MQMRNKKQIPQLFALLMLPVYTIYFLQWIFMSYCGVVEINYQLCGSTLLHCILPHQLTEIKQHSSLLCSRIALLVQLAEKHESGSCFVGSLTRAFWFTTEPELRSFVPASGHARWRYNLINESPFGLLISVSSRDLVWCRSAHTSFALFLPPRCYKWIKFHVDIRNSLGLQVGNLCPEAQRWYLISSFSSTCCHPVTVLFLQTLSYERKKNI